jgi:hypothetical protein
VRLFILTNIVLFLLIGLATWNLSSLLVQENGPFAIFSRLRHALGVRYTPDQIVYAANPIAELFTCVWCMSRWIALLLVLLVLLLPNVMMWALMILAASTVAILIDGWTRHG